MGHMVAKDIYGALGEKIDNLHVRTPQTEAFYAMLRELYSPDEAELIVAMPFGLSTLERIAKVTGRDRKELEPMLAALCDKGLVVDVRLGDSYHYMPAPFVIGIFEFTMMRMDHSDPDIGKVSRLFVDYLESGEFYAANFKDGQQVSVARALPHLEHLGDHVEILDYEKVERIVDAAETFSLSNCSCRHKKHHAGGQVCKVPLETCTSFGSAADYLVRHGMGRAISKSEMKDVVQRSKELKLVFSVDNVRNQPAFLCHCCGCCCGILEGINKHGYPNAIVSSTLVPHVRMEDCNGCQKCARACHVSAITLVPGAEDGEQQEDVHAADRRDGLHRLRRVQSGLRAGRDRNAQARAARDSSGDDLRARDPAVPGAGNAAESAVRRSRAPDAQGDARHRGRIPAAATGEKGADVGHPAFEVPVGHGRWRCQDQPGGCGGSVEDPRGIGRRGDAGGCQLALR